jgi:hypothetical protein
MQEWIEVFAEWIQERHLYVLRYLASVFSNSVSILIVILGLSGYSNRYWTTVTVIHNSFLVCGSVDTSSIYITVGTRWEV